MNNSEFTNPPSNSDKTVAEKLGITKTGKVTIGILLVILILFASIVAKNFLVVPIPHNSIIVGGNRLFMSFNLGSINYAFSLDQFRIITRTLQRNLREEVEWSPDGKWFASSIEEVVNGRYSTNIYIMRADGSQRTLIPPPDRGYGRQPTWLLNGKQIAYTVLVGGDEDGTYITNVECILREESCVLKPRRLIQPDLGYLVLFPDWSPDGRQIIYHHNGDIFVMNVDGQSPPVNLTLNFDGEMFSPKWSPDGTKIVGLCSIKAYLNNICVMNKDGSNFAYLTQEIEDTNILHVRWSPDGKKIAYISRASDLNIGGFCGDSSPCPPTFPTTVFIMNATGTEKKQLPFGSFDIIDWFDWYP